MFTFRTDLGYGGTVMILVSDTVAGPKSIVVVVFRRPPIAKWELGV